MRRTRSFKFFTIGFTQIAIIFPFLVAAPGYFTGIFTLGVLMQIVTIFNWQRYQVPALVVRELVSGLGQRSFWRATGFQQTRRLRARVARRAPVDKHSRTFGDARRAHAHRARSRDRLAGRSTAADPCRTQDRSGRAVRSNGSVRKRQVDALPCACRSLAVCARPIGCSVGQHCVSSATSVRAAWEPTPGGDVYHRGREGVSGNRVQFRQALKNVGLEEHEQLLDVTANWAQRLSGGELQRLALARALVNAPDWLFLDEALSALGEAAGASLLDLLRHQLPTTQIVLITHSKALAARYERRATIDHDALVLEQTEHAAGSLELI